VRLVECAAEHEGRGGGLTVVALGAWCGWTSRWWRWGRGLREPAFLALPHRGGEWCLREHAVQPGTAGSRRSYSCQQLPVVCLPPRGSLMASPPCPHPCFRTGPLTNIALALKLDPKLPSRLRRLVVMGGSGLRAKVWACGRVRVWVWGWVWGCGDGCGCVCMCGCADMQNLRCGCGCKIHETPHHPVQSVRPVLSGPQPVSHAAAPQAPLPSTGRRAECGTGMWCCGCTSLEDHPQSMLLLPSHTTAGGGHLPRAGIQPRVRSGSCQDRAGQVFCSQRQQQRAAGHPGPCRLGHE